MRAGYRYFPRCFALFKRSDGSGKWEDTPQGKTILSRFLLGCDATTNTSCHRVTNALNDKLLFFVLLRGDFYLRINRPIFYLLHFIHFFFYKNTTRMQLKSSCNVSDCSEKSTSIVPYGLLDCSFTVHFTDQAFSLFHYCKDTISSENWVAIFSIFLRDSITGFAACRVSRLFRVSSHSPLL